MSRGEVWNTIETVLLGVNSSSSVCFGYGADKSVSCFASHLGTRIIVSFQSWVGWFSTDKALFEEYSQMMHGINRPSWCCNLEMLNSMFDVSTFVLYTTKIVSCPFMPSHSRGIIVKLGLLQITSFIIHVTQAELRPSGTKIRCLCR